ncbi:MAG: hypothetical protein Q8936_15265 [Bacillota bacterium]|nr:hypothetical protein [Bacillota bacterium]
MKIKSNTIIAVLIAALIISIGININRFIVANKYQTLFEDIESYEANNFRADNIDLKNKINEILRNNKISIQDAVGLEKYSERYSADYYKVFKNYDDLNSKVYVEKDTGKKTLDSQVVSEMTSYLGSLAANIIDSHQDEIELQDSDVKELKQISALCNKVDITYMKIYTDDGLKEHKSPSLEWREFLDQLGNLRGDYVEVLK